MEVFLLLIYAGHSIYLSVPDLRAEDACRELYGEIAKRRDDALGRQQFDLTFYCVPYARARS